MRWFRRLPAWLTLASVGFVVLAPPAMSGPDRAPRVTADSLHSLLEQALVAFSANDFVAAADLFQRLERDFGAEPEYQDPVFQRRMLPLKGHAELTAGLPAAAAVTLNRFVEAFPGDSQHASSLFALGMALRQNGRAREAADRFKEFEESYPQRPESGLALLQRTELLFTLGREDEALAVLETFSTGEAPAILRLQARIRAARQMLERKDPVTAGRLLLNHPWDVETLPEIAVLSFTALELGDLLMEAGSFADAVRAYRLVLPRARLVESQDKRIVEISNRLRQPVNEGQRFWNDYYRRLLESMRRQATALEASEDYTPSLLLRRGQAMLLVDRPHEAWLLFEQLALDETLPTELREEAHYRWILAANGLELWEEALTIARNFLARYPNAPLAPQALYLIAQAHQEQRRYAETLEILTDLLARFPDHALAQRWRFTRGFNRVLLEDFREGRADFLRAAEDFPDGSLTANAELWHALTFFFERDYRTALSGFDTLARRYQSHLIEGEILYRRASTLYAMREYDQAEIETAAFIARFPRHQRHGETLVLLGDILMGAGKLDQARATFQQIEPDAGHLFLYGLFQQGKILRAQQDYDEMIALFSSYAERTDLEEKPRLSEVLYWIGWAHDQEGRPEEAAPLFLGALERYGNDPASGEIGSILDLLNRMHPLPRSSETDFSSWIEKERQDALVLGRLTYFSRLTLQLAQIKRKQNLPYQAENLLFEIATLAPLDSLGPEALGPVGHLLLIKELETAEAFFNALLKEYPHAPERAFAYHGFGQIHHRRGNYEEALIWLRRFENETPTHPLASEALLLAGDNFLALKRHEEAAATFEEILRLRAMRGRPHAAALIGLANTMIAAAEPERAIAYFQRVYTVHRAQSDLVARAYFESSRLFEELDDPSAAHRSLTEMLSLNELANSEYLESARESERRLASELAIVTALTPE